MSFRLVLAIGELEVGGTQRQMLELAKRIDRNQFAPEVLCLSRSLAFAGEFAQVGIPVEVVEKKFRYDFSVISRLKAFLQGTDFLITFGFTANVWCRVAARWAGVPVVVSSVRTSSEESLLIDFVNRALVPFTDHYIANSNAAGGYLRKIGVAAEKCSIIVNGFDLERITTVKDEPEAVRCSLDISESSFCVGMVSRLSPEKNVESYLRIAQAFCQTCPDAVFVVVGDGPEAERLKHLALEWKLGSNLRWLGERNDVPRLLRCFDIVMLTSLREGLSNTLLEYMAAGLPIVASNVGGNAEVIDHGKTGFLFSVNDTGQAVRHLERLRGDRDFCLRLGQQARLEVASRFAMPQIIARTQELLIRLAADKTLQRKPYDRSQQKEPAAAVAKPQPERRPN